MQRTPIQDLRFSFEQLVEVAVRALSPGTNDPFTAINCVDQLGSVLRQLKGRPFPSPYHSDTQGVSRVESKVVTMADYTSIAFEDIRFYAKEHPGVLARIDSVLVRL